MENSIDLRTVVADAFKQTYGGHSVDDVVIDDELNREFIRVCQLKADKISPKELNWTLYNLRKSGELGPVGAKGTSLNHDDYVHAAEIAARAMV